MVFKKEALQKKKQRGRVCGQREFNIIYVFVILIMFVHFTNILVHTTQTTLVTFL